MKICLTSRVALRISLPWQINFIYLEHSIKMDVESVKVPDVDKYWILKKEIKVCFLIGNLLLGFLQIQLCFHYAKVSQFPIRSISVATFNWIEFWNSIFLAFLVLLFLIKQENDSTELLNLAVFGMMFGMALAVLNCSRHSGISKINSAPCDVLDGVSIKNPYVVEWKKTLSAKFVSPKVSLFAQNNSLSVKKLQFEVMIETQKLSFEEVIELTVENEPSVKLVCSVDYSWPIASMCKWTIQRFATVVYYQRLSANLMIIINALFFFFINCFFAPKDPITLDRPSRWSTVFVFLLSSFQILSTLMWFLHSMFLNVYFLLDVDIPFTGLLQILPQLVTLFREKSPIIISYL